ncbi:MAG TPA: glycoside hydrolase family 27 protein, partial [Bryobacteraceae bacterium]
RDAWQSMDNIGFGTATPGVGQNAPRVSQFDLAPSAKPGHFNDPDMLEVGNGHMTNDEYKVHFSLWSLLASPLLAGNDIRNMTPETKDILMNAEVIAINQDPAVLPAKRLTPADATSVVVVRPLKDKSVAVGLFNRGGAPADIGVDLKDLGLKGTKFQGRDLWKHEPVTISGDRYSASVPSHAVVLLKVSAK